MEKKEEIIIKMLPSDIKTILDVGVSRNCYPKYDVTTIDCVKGADIIQDFNKSQKLPFEDNSFDLVMANQILEHLANSEEIMSEIKRISKKYIFIGLPNELNWKARIKFLIGRPDWSGYSEYHHKHFFTISKIEEFIKIFFGKYKKREYWEPSRHKLFPNSLNEYLAGRFPTSFSKEAYYLIDMKDCKKETKYDTEAEIQCY